MLESLGVDRFDAIDQLYDILERLDVQPPGVSAEQFLSTFLADGPRDLEDVAAARIEAGVQTTDFYVALNQLCRIEVTPTATYVSLRQPQMSKVGREMLDRLANKMAASVRG